MSLLDIASLFMLMLTLAIIPSTSVALVVTRSVTHGIANGVAVSAGIVTGDLVFILLIIAGLSVVAESMSWLFIVIKYIGASYLIWLGFALIFDTRKNPFEVNKNTGKANLLSSFLAGLFLTLGDIKAIFLYVSLLPAFVDLATLTISETFIIMTITIVTVGGVKVIYELSATKVVALSRGLKLENGAKKVTGGMMVGVGSYLIVKA